MPPKRPNDSDGGLSGGGSGSTNGVAKRPRTSGPGEETKGSPQNVQVQIEAARARAQVMANLNPTPSTARPPRSDASNSTSRPSAEINVAAMQRQLAEAKQRALDRAGNLGKGSPTPPTGIPQRTEGPPPSGIHPLLAEKGISSSAAPSSKPLKRTNPYAARTHMAPKFSTLGANARAVPPSAPIEEPVEKTNPYLARQESEGEDGEARPSSGPRQRNMHRGFAFNRPGRHVRAAEEARREAQMEALKKRIAESSRKAGMEELSAEERALRRNPPSEVEWWDMALLPDKTYEAVEAMDKGKSKEGPLLEGEDSPIDHYVQHPIPIPAPSDKVKVDPKGVMLTKKEMKKMRRQRRQAEQEDKQDRIKMGLLPPDPPKVKLSNLMRVLTSEAVADPTKIEARVRREVAARKDQHERTNLERMLTPEERRAKVQAKQEADESKGIYSLVFKIKHLVSPSHKFKVRKNAQQNGLTGLTVFHPNFALVVVEGPSKGIKAYKRLMTVRMEWTDPGRAHTDVEDEGVGTPAPSSVVTDPTKQKEQEEMTKVDWSQNRCDLIFEGPLRERLVPQGFRAKHAPSDTDAKEILGPKMAGYWDLARKHASATEE